MKKGGGASFGARFAVVVVMVVAVLVQQTAARCRDDCRKQGDSLMKECLLTFLGPRCCKVMKKVTGKCMCFFINDSISKRMIDNLTNLSVPQSCGLTLPECPPA